MAKRLKIFQTYTSVYYWNRDSKRRFIVNQGGTSSSKTYSICQRLSMLAIKNPGVVITVVARTAKSLERGALRDFKTLIDSSDVFRSLIVDPTLVQGPYRFKNGSIMEFVNLNDAANAKYGKRDYLFLNEANEINYEAAHQLMMRTKHQIFIDYNPDAEFWVHEDIITRKDCDYFISNFKHNPWCAEETINDLLEYKQKWEASGDQGLRNKYDFAKLNGSDPKVIKKLFSDWNKTSSQYWRNKWYVYGLGLTGVVEGVIYENVNYIQHLPLGMRKKGYFLDFGFKIDPTAFGKAGMKRGEVYGKQLIYELGLTTPDLIKKFKLLGISKRDLIIADPSNADAIAQIKRKGYNIVEAKKPPGSVKSGIDALQGLEINITHDSKDWKVEHQKYKYERKKGVWSNDPHDSYNHLWDGFRYWYQYWYPPLKKTKKRSTKPRRIRIIR